MKGERRDKWKAKFFKFGYAEPHPIFAIAKIVKREDYSGERELFSMYRFTSGSDRSMAFGRSYGDACISVKDRWRLWGRKFTVMDWTTVCMKDVNPFCVQSHCMGGGAGTRHKIVCSSTQNRSQQNEKSFSAERFFVWRTKFGRFPRRMGRPADGFIFQKGCVI